MAPQGEAEEKVPRTVTWVDGRAATFGAVHATPSESFLGFAFHSAGPDVVAADAACGAGTFTLMLASRVGRVVAADRDETALRAAVGEAKARRAKNVEFYESDLEEEAWTEWAPEAGVDLVTMHLYASPHAFREAARVLKPGGALVVSAFGPGQWQETGQPSPWAWAPRDLRRGLTDAGLTVERLVNDLVFVNAPDFGILRQIYFEGGSAPIVDKWKADGRWDGLQESFRDGTRGLTESRLVARAVRPM